MFVLLKKELPLVREYSLLYHKVTEKQILKFII